MSKKTANILLTPVAMGAVDKAAAASGIDSFGLMMCAGEAVAAAALRLFPGALRYVVLAGPGNNGGDAYIAARALLASGGMVSLYAFGLSKASIGDAARARGACGLLSLPLEDYNPSAGDVVIDGLFGAIPISGSLL